jgi:hypothetical protein
MGHTFGGDDECVDQRFEKVDRLVEFLLHQQCFYSDAEAGKRYSSNEDAPLSHSMNHQEKIPTHCFLDTMASE